MQKIRNRFLTSLAVLLSAVSANAVTIQEDFAADPASRGWQVAGDQSLFQWTDSALRVTWDSSKPNSYYHLPFGNSLTRADTFSVSFDLRLSDFVSGVDPQEPNIFELSAGFINLSEATSAQFLRGTGFDSPDLIEFSFFPDPADLFTSVTGIAVDSTGTNWSTGGFGNFGLLAENVYRIKLAYDAYASALTTTVTLNGQSIGEVSKAVLGSSFSNFKVDQFAICSYNDAGQDPAYAGSILAHGIVDNVTLEFPDRIQGAIVSGIWQVQFWTSADRIYTVERSTDLKTWEPASEAIRGSGTRVAWVDNTPPRERAAYRVSSKPL